MCSEEDKTCIYNGFLSQLEISLIITSSEKAKTNSLYNIGHMVHLICTEKVIFMIHRLVTDNKEQKSEIV